MTETLHDWFGAKAPSLSTVKRWEQKAYGRISADDAAMVAEVAGCSVEWVLTGKGDPPAPTRGVREPERPYGAKGRAGASGRGGAESGAPSSSDIDLLEEIVRHPEQFARRMQTATAEIGVEAVLAFLDDAEAICRERGHSFTRFFATLRARLRAGGAAAGGTHA